MRKSLQIKKDQLVRLFGEVQAFVKDDSVKHLLEKLNISSSSLDLQEAAKWVGRRPRILVAGTENRCSKVIKFRDFIALMTPSISNY